MPTEEFKESVPQAYWDRRTGKLVLTPFVFKPYANCEESCSLRMKCNLILSVSGTKMHCTTLGKDVDKGFLVKHPAFISKLDFPDFGECSLNKSIHLKKDGTCSIEYRCSSRNCNNCAARVAREFKFRQDELVKRVTSSGGV